MQRIGKWNNLAKYFFYTVTGLALLLDFVLFLAFLTRPNSEILEPLAVFSVVTLILVVISLVLWYTMGKTSYSETPAFFVLTHRRGNHVVQFAEITQCSVTPAMDYLVVTDARGQKVKINVTWFIPGELLRYLLEPDGNGQPFLRDDRYLVNQLQDCYLRCLAKRKKLSSQS